MHRYRFEQFVSVRLLTTSRYAPEGDRFAYVANTTGLPNLWLQPAGGGFPRQLTSFTDRRVGDFAWSPDGGRIAFLADRDGDEMYQLYVVDADGGWPRQLTDAPKVQYELGGWLPDGRSVVITGNDREPSEMDPQCIDVETGEVTRLVTGGGYHAGEPAPSGNRVPIVEFLSNTSQRLFLLDLDSGERLPIAPREGVAKAMPGPWRGDGSGLYFATDEGRDFTGLAYADAHTGAWSYVVAEEHELDGATVSGDGLTLAAVVNIDGASELRRVSLADGGHEPRPAPDLPLGVVNGLSLHPSRGEALLLHTTPQHAPNLVQLELGGGTSRILEQSMLGGVDPSELSLPEAVRYPSFDRDIPGWLYRPEGAGPFPTVLSIHGGPEGQERPQYAYLGLYQYLVSRGIAVLAPNIRGSSGFGTPYQRLIYRDWGGDELRDIEAAAQYLRAAAWADSERLAVFGASFGGFATLSAVTRLPEYWAAGVDMVGPSNLVTFAGSVPSWWRPMIKGWVGDAEEDRDLLRERSPISYVDQVRVPLLVIQGANDPRVVQAESDQMVDKLREQGLEVEYHVDENAGHGPADRDGWIDWLDRTARFLERHLLTTA
ncbi:MAG: S9 family peptidase [Deinococcales bacterium]